MKVREFQKAEISLAKKLFEEGIKFKQQYNTGRYTVDFLIEGKLVVEIEGLYHENPEQKDKDLKRYDDLKNLGYEVLRIPTSEFHDLDSLVNLIRNYLKRLKS